MNAHAEEVPPRGAAAMLTTVRARTQGILRITRWWAVVATVASIWLWLLTSHAITGAWFSVSPLLLLLLLLVIAPAVVLWLFYQAAHSLLRLPDDLRRLMEEGRLQSSDLAARMRTWGSQPSGRRVWSVLRSILELRTLLFRGRGILVATGMAIRFRFLNPLALAGVFLAFLASGAIVLGAAAATLLALILAI